MVRISVEITKHGRHHIEWTDLADERWVSALLCHVYHRVAAWVIERFECRLQWIVCLHSWLICRSFGRFCSETVSVFRVRRRFDHDFPCFLELFEWLVLFHCMVVDVVRVLSAKGHCWVRVFHYRAHSVCISCHCCTLVAFEWPSSLVDFPLPLRKLAYYSVRISGKDVVEIPCVLHLNQRVGTSSIQTVILLPGIIAHLPRCARKNDLWALHVVVLLHDYRILAWSVLVLHVWQHLTV